MKIIRILLHFSSLQATRSDENVSYTGPSRTILSNESILSQASDHSNTRDIRSAVFPVTIDRTGFTSLGFHVVVSHSFLRHH